MAKKQLVSGRWDDAELKELKKLIKENTPTPVMAIKLNRAENSIRSKVRTEGLSLKPTNRRPYG
jgi:hypothetical protein